MQQQFIGITNQKKDLVLMEHLCGFTHTQGGLTARWLTRINLVDTKETSCETEAPAQMKLLLCVGAHIKRKDIWLQPLCPKEIFFIEQHMLSPQQLKINWSPALTHWLDLCLVSITLHIVSHSFQVALLPLQVLHQHPCYSLIQWPVLKIKPLLLHVMITVHITVSQLLNRSLWVCQVQHKSHP